MSEADDQSTGESRSLSRNSKYPAGKQNGYETRCVQETRHVSGLLAL